MAAVGGRATNTDFPTIPLTKYLENVYTISEPHSIELILSLLFHGECGALNLNTNCITMVLSLFTGSHFA